MVHANQLLAEALELPADERKALAHALLRSVDERGDDEAHAAWDEALVQRAERVANGTADLVPWEEAEASLRAELRARREARGR